MTPSAPDPAPLEPLRERWALHLGLLGATFVSVSGVRLVLGDAPAEAATFAAALLGILASHELGHYWVGKRYGVSISPPYFIPLPIGIGTLGAIIRIRSAPPSRRALIDLAAAGPFAGMALALPLLIWSVAHSRYAPAAYAAGLQLPGRLSLWGLARELAQAMSVARGDLGARVGFALRTLPHLALPDPAVGWSGDNLLLLGLSRALLGPRPPGQDLELHPLGFAAWVAMLFTMLNLLPLGQLDGGHVAFALFGERARALGRAVRWGMLGLAAVGSLGWLVWFALTSAVVLTEPPELLAPEEPLPRSRYWLGLAVLALLVVTFLPVPFELRPS